MQDLPSHVAGIVTGQEQEARRDFIWLAGPLHRRLLAKLGNLLRVLAAKRIERGPDWPRRNRVHSNALLDQI